MSNPAHLAICVLLQLAGVAMFFAVWPMLSALNAHPVNPQSVFLAFVLCAPGILFIGAGAAFSRSIR